MKQYFTTKQLSELLGRSEPAIRNLVMRRRIPFRKPAGRLLFLAEEIYRWVEQSPGKRLEELTE